MHDNVVSKDEDSPVESEKILRLQKNIRARVFCAPSVFQGLKKNTVAISLVIRQAEHKRGVGTG